MGSCHDASRSTRVVGAASLAVLLLACSAQLPPVRIPGFDPARFTVEHPDNSVREAPRGPTAGDPSPAPVNGHPDEQPPSLSTERLKTRPASAVLRPRYALDGATWSLGLAFGCEPSDTSPGAPTQAWICGPRSVFPGPSTERSSPSREELGARLSGLTATGHREDGVFASGASPGLLRDAGGPREGDLRDDTMIYAVVNPSRLAILPLAATPPAPLDAATLVVLSADERAAPIEIVASVVDSSPSLLIYEFPPALTVSEGTAETLEEPYAFRGGPVVNGAGEVIGMHIVTRRHDGRLYGAAVPAASLDQQLRVLRVEGNEGDEGNEDDEVNGGVKGYPGRPDPLPATSTTLPFAEVPAVPAVPRPPDRTSDSKRP